KRDWSSDVCSSDLLRIPYPRMKLLQQVSLMQQASCTSMVMAPATHLQWSLDRQHVASQFTPILLHPHPLSAIVILLLMASFLSMKLSQQVSSARVAPLPPTLISPL